MEYTHIQINIVMISKQIKKESIKCNSFKLTGHPIGEPDLNTMQQSSKSISISVKTVLATTLDKCNEYRTKSCVNDQKSEVKHPGLCFHHPKEG